MLRKSIRNHTLLSLTLLALSGCANQNVWVRDNTSGEVAQKDFAECKYDSQKSSFVPFGNGTSPISAGVQEGFQSVNLLDGCMRSRGYYLTNRLKQENKNARDKQLVDEFKSAMENKDYNKAFEIVSSLISINPNVSALYFDRGNVYYHMGKYNNAVVDYNKAIQLGFNIPSVFVLKSQAFIILGEYDIAIESINQALSTKIEASFYNIRAYALNKKGEYDKALEDCNRSIALDTSKPNAYKNRGLAYYGKRDYEKAIEQFNKSISIDPLYDLAYSGRAETYLITSKIENATSDFKKACELGDKDSCLKVK